MPRLRVVTVALFAGLVAGAAAAAAAEKFIPYGHSYAPGSGPIPGLNSPQDRINNQADIYQAEIWHKQRERKLFDSEMQRFINHDLSPGSYSRPIY